MSDMTPTDGNDDELKAMLQEAGEKIVNAIVISIAIDEDFDTQSIEDWLYEHIKQYGLQSKLDVLEELKQEYRNNIVSDDRMEMEINDIVTRLKAERNSNSLEFGAIKKQDGKQ